MKKTSRLLLGIFGLLLGIVWIFPFYMILTNSFKTPKGIFASVLSLPVQATTENYKNSF